MLIIANTAVASVFALKYETKIVSVLSFLGGAFAPFFLNTSGDQSIYYAYLWLLIVGSNYVAYRIK